MQSGSCEEPWVAEALRIPKQKKVAQIKLQRQLETVGVDILWSV